MQYIKMTPELIEQYKAGLEKKLSEMKLREEKTFNIVPIKVETDKVKLVFTDLAYAKIKALVDESDTEVGWHGFTTKDGNTYTVTDVVVFPQDVTGTTVTPDAKKYTDWMNALTDEQYNAMHFHGHSHVNMGVCPSAVDTNYQDNQIQNVDDYYIFIITNKREEINAFIFDIENNIFYEKHDIDIVVPINSVKKWAKEQLKKYITEPKVAAPAYTQQTFYTGTSKKGYESYWEKQKRLEKETEKSKSKNKNSGKAKTPSRSDTRKSAKTKNNK